MNDCGRFNCSWGTRAQLTVSMTRPHCKIGIYRWILFDWPIHCNVQWKSLQNRSLPIFVVPQPERSREIGCVRIDEWLLRFWKMSYLASTCNSAIDVPFDGPAGKIRTKVMIVLALLPFFILPVVIKFRAMFTVIVL